jgi:hypothetical protein
MPAPARPAPIKTYPDSARFTNGIVGHYSDAEVDALLANAATGNVDLTGYAKAEDLPIVYEQLAEPVGKDGDLWLKPAASVALAPASLTADKSAVTMNDVRDAIGDYLLDPASAAAIEFKHSLLDAVKLMLNGGKMPPEDLPWTECPKVAGSGLVEARLVNGIIQLRGSITITTSSWTTVRKLPANFPRPSGDYNTLTAGGETGVAERVCQVSIRTGGDIAINSFGSKITALSTFPATAPVV